jgi:hypothetical protein
MPLRNQGQPGESYLPARKKKAFIVPLPADARVIRGQVELLGIKDNFFEVEPAPMPKGWKFSARTGKVSRIAEISVDYKNKTGDIVLDSRVFEDREVPQGCKIFMFYHELGHPLFKANEKLCDEFALWHALRDGVTPFLCFLALAAYMPDHYQDRVENLGRIILNHPQLKQFTDAD